MLYVSMHNLLNILMPLAHLQLQKSCCSLTRNFSQYLHPRHSKRFNSDKIGIANTICSVWNRVPVTNCSYAIILSSTWITFSYLL
jgi:hypothetical protein